MNIKAYRDKINRLIKKISLPKIRLPFYCPVCDTKISHFEPLDDFYIQAYKNHKFPYPLEGFETLNYKNYYCPKCHASDRDRLIALFLKEQVWDREITVMQFAPSESLSGFITKNPRVKYRTADLFMRGVDDKVDLMDMHIYQDETFDIFICSHVLEHVDNDKKALSEIYRVLKHNGYAILLVPIPLSLQETDEDPSISEPSIRWQRFGQDDHVRLYAKKDFRDRILSAGFTLREVTVDNYSSEIFYKTGIALSSVLYIAIKQ
jgi:SAM-dependent methyltransferase